MKSHLATASGYAWISGGEITARVSRDAAPLLDSLRLKKSSLKDQHGTAALLIPD